MYAVFGPVREEAWSNCESGQLPSVLVFRVETAAAKVFQHHSLAQNTEQSKHPSPRAFSFLLGALT